VSIVTDTKDGARSDLQDFAASVAHEIRTPLVAVAGEVELALRRDRTPEEYRESLRRIAAGVSELVELSGDLTLLSDPVDATVASHAAILDVILARIRDRYTGRQDVRIESDERTSRARVTGNEERLARAITLVIDHALKFRKPGTSIFVRTAVPDARIVRLVIDAPPSGFWPHAWSALAGQAPVALRLRTAQRILDAHGGALLVGCASDTDVAHVELQRCI